MSAASWTFLNIYTPVVARISGHSGDGLRMDWGWIEDGLSKKTIELMDLKRGFWE